METQPDISHQMIVAYLRGTITDDDRDQIQNAKAKQSAFQLLFDLIDDLKTKTVTREKAAESVNTPTTLSAQNELLLRITAGGVLAEDAQQFIDGMLFSPVFYRRVFAKLATSQAVASEDVPELAEVEIRSDEEILAKISNMTSLDEPGTRAVRHARKSSILSKLDRLRNFPAKMVPRLRYAVPAFIVIAIVVFGGRRFYNTTYRIHQAEMILKDNYRVYMAETPRLSGEYASTGIRQLMSKEEDKDAYLDEAFDKVSAAASSGSRSPKVNQLWAHVFVIRKQYSKADSVLNQIETKSSNSAAILNDYGVLKFSQENWEEAAQYFASAIDKDPNFKEAYYNLALAQERLGEKETISTLNRYLELETDEGWKRAASQFLKELRGNKE